MGPGWGLTKGLGVVGLGEEVGIARDLALSAYEGEVLSLEGTGEGEGREGFVVVYVRGE